MTMDMPLAKDPSYQTTKCLELHEVPPIPPASRPVMSSDDSLNQIHRLHTDGDRHWHFFHGKLFSYYHYRPKSERDAGAYPWLEMYVDLEAQAARNHGRAPDRYQYRYRIIRD